MPRFCSGGGKTDGLLADDAVAKAEGKEVTPMIPFEVHSPLTDPAPDVNRPSAMGSDVEDVSLGPSIQEPSHADADPFAGEATRKIRYSSAEEARPFDGNSDDLLTVVKLPASEGAAGSFPSFSCYLYRQSDFYRHMRLHQHKWKLRWFTFDADAVQSCRSPREPERNIRRINIYEASRVQVDSSAEHTFFIDTPDGRVVLRAASRDIMAECVAQISALISAYSGVAPDRRRAMRDAAYKLSLTKRSNQEVREEVRKVATSGGGGGASEKHSIGARDSEYELLTQWPEDPARWRAALHVALLPIKCALFYSIPDVRIKSIWGGSAYIVSMVMSVVWLAGASYVMVFCMDTIGAVLDISSAIMGLTVGAMGTSFPNLFSSMLVARQGMGDMAISNAFGSNVFNICMGLGLPWLFANFAKEGGDYEDLPSEGIAPATYILLGVLGFYVAGLYYFDFVLHKPVAWVCLAAFVVWLVYALIPHGHD